MRSRPTNDNINTFVAQVVRTLPDSLNERKVVLVTLLALLPRDYEHRFQIKQLLHLLHTHESSQLTLPGILRAEEGARS